MQQEAKSIVDAVAVSGGVASLAGWLPEAAAGVTIVWLSIRIWESDTVKGIFGRKDE
jgi:hypothetical protein